MTEFVYCKTQMSASDTDTLMKLWRSSHTDQLFNDHQDLYDHIDACTLGDVSWEKATLQYQGEKPTAGVPEWMEAGYEIFYRDPREVVKNMIGDPNFAGAFEHAPYQEFDSSGSRRYQNLMSGDWAWKQAVSLNL